jgi:hypothetical protein
MCFKIKRIIHIELEENSNKYNRKYSPRTFAILCVIAVKIGRLLSHRKDDKDRGDTQRGMLSLERI